MTKNEELLKGRIDETFDNPKIRFTPQLVDNTLHLCASGCVHFDSEVKAAVVQPKKHVVKTKMTKKTQLERATAHLYDLESCNTTEKTLNINLHLYQMEEY
ncbi:MAG: hypothetical protein LBC12_07915 [Nitrososphaerota archaeon]|nr:hypothetical protein [Nitrososphaerota archaeon]